MSSNPMPTPRTRVVRESDRGVYDRDAVNRNPCGYDTTYNRNGRASTTVFGSSPLTRFAPKYCADRSPPSITFKCTASSANTIVAIVSRARPNGVAAACHCFAITCRKSVGALLLLTWTVDVLARLFWSLLRRDLLRYNRRRTVTPQPRRTTTLPETAPAESTDAELDVIYEQK